MSPWQKLMARFHVNGKDSRFIVEWAYTELLAGRDTENLRILAGFRSPLDWSEVEHYFNATLRDLGWQVEDGAPYLREYIVEIARDIVNGVRPPLQASSEIYCIYGELDYSNELHDWLYVTDGMAPDTGEYVDGSALNAVILRAAKRTIAQSSRNQPPE